jgi:predicted ATPase/DNA-binding CsgD family transcriptional regulator
MVYTLPVFLAPLIGREQELTTLEQLLRHPGARLVTLTGPGGVGKTRLAAAAASLLLNDYPEAITFVSLVPVAAPEYVMPAIAGVMGIQEGEETGETALERIARYIHEKAYLLIVDNFEHVIEAAAEIPQLLAACPNLKIIATSRQLLRVRGEQEFAVPLLGMPDIEHLARDIDVASVLPRYSAVQLFLERMHAIRVDYVPDQAALRAIAALCVRLDGLPLAIELAAPRTRMFTPEQLLVQLGGQGISSLKLLTGGARDLPARQRTLSRTIQWSYDLLSPQEQSAFRAASIFADSFALEQAEKLLTSFPEKQLELSHTDLIASLVEKNLLRQDSLDAEPRFRMLVMLQEFGRAEAERMGETPSLHAAHAATFLELAETSVPKLYTREQVEITARLRRDVDNLRQALRWALDWDEIETAARLGAALWRFWLLGGLLSEGQNWLKEILERLGRNLESAEADQMQSRLGMLPPAEIRQVAELLYGLGNLAFRQSGSGRPEVTSWLRQSRDLNLQIGDQTKAALAMTALARAMLFLQEDLDASQSLLDESFEIMQAAGHKIGIAENLYVQARNYFYLNQPDKADGAMQHSLALLQESGNIYELAYATQFAADLAFGRAGSYGEVRRQYAEAAEMFAALGNVTESAVASAMVGVLTGWIEGDWSRTLQVVEEGRQVAREHGNERAVVLCTAMAAWVYGYLGDYVEARNLALEAIRSAFLLSHHLGLRTAFIGLANVERLEGDYAAAVTTVSAMMSYRARYNSLVSSRSNSLYLTSLSQLKRELGPAAFAQAWAKGPARLAELLAQPDSESASWPLASIPEMDSPETSGQPGRETPPVSKVTASSLPFSEPLTAREKEVLECLVQGMTDPQIAEVLVISPRTVHAHLRNIYAKLGVNTRTTAARLALEHSLL